MKAVVLAGGIGTRLRPLTYVLPKSMLPVGDKPILEHIINYLEKNEVTDIVLATAYLGRVIEDYFRDGSQWDVKIEYAKANRPLGTAGQLKTSERLIDDTFIGINGDILVDVDLKDMLKFHRSNKGVGTVALKVFDVPVKYGIITLDQEEGERIIQWQEKPEISLIMNVGLYVFETEIFDFIEKGRPMSLEKDVFPRIIDEGKQLYGYLSDTQYFDVGDMDALERVNQEFLKEYLGKI